MNLKNIKGLVLLPKSSWPSAPQLSGGENPLNTGRAGTCPVGAAPSGHRRGKLGTVRSLHQEEGAAV